jgi:isoleucyl-tRNA synthetase
VAATDYRNEMSVSEQILKRTADAYRRIRNTARFLLANLNGFDPAQNLLEPARMIELDRWAVDRTLQLQEQIVAAYRDYQFHLIYQKIQNFCTNELGGFYLDIIKDRQYTTQADSLPRRSCQTAMYHIVEAMCRWLAPILSFTADEIWREIPGERGESVFLEGWYTGLFALDAGENFDRAFWAKVIEVREAVGKSLEAFRAAGNSSLDAEIDLYCSDELQAMLDRMTDELRFVMITSEVQVLPLADKPTDISASELQGLAIQVKASEHGKCVRCWHHRSDVGASTEHPELCGRCVVNVAGPGETRRFA